MQKSGEKQQHDSGYLSPLEITFDFEEADLIQSTSDDPSYVFIDSPAPSSTESDEDIGAELDWNVMYSAMSQRRRQGTDDSSCTESKMVGRAVGGNSDHCRPSYYRNCPHCWSRWSKDAKQTIDVATATEDDFMRRFCGEERCVFAAQQTSTQDDAWLESSPIITHRQSSSHNKIASDKISDISFKLATMGDDFHRDWLSTADNSSIRCGIFAVTSAFGLTVQAISSLFPPKRWAQVSRIRRRKCLGSILVL